MCSITCQGCGAAAQAAGCNGQAEARFLVIPSLGLGHLTEHPVVSPGIAFVIPLQTLAFFTEQCRSSLGAPGFQRSLAV